MEQQTKTKYGSAARVGVVLFLLLAVIFLVWRFVSYTNTQLYEESRSQMTEIMEQNYEKLKVVLDAQWNYTMTLENMITEANPKDEKALGQVLAKAREMLTPLDDSYRFLAVDEEGYYYDENGRQGIWEEASSLERDDRRQSFLTNAFSENGNNMAFAYRLENAVPIGKEHTAKLTDVVLLKSMESLTEHFRCSAFNDRNITYVMKNNGVKMYSDNASDETLFPGRNIYYALGELEFPHMGSFDACLSALDEDGYVCTDVKAGDNRYFLCLDQINGYSWTLLFMVSDEYVATSTTKMVSSMIALFSMALIMLLAAAYLVLYSHTQARQDKERYEMGVRTAAVLSAANDNLERARQSEERARQTAEDALRIAESANRAKTEFLANMSHDIRTPMNAIVGISNLMEHDMSDPDKLRDYVHKVQLSSKYLLGLLNDILDMSKIESSEVSLHQESLNLASQIGQLDSIIRPQAAARGQKFQIAIHDIKHENIIGDGMRLRQVLLNILSNAVKYTQNGGRIGLDVFEVPCSSENHARYRFTITDNGMGMSEELLEHLYEPFVRGEASVTNKIQGTGLSMAITKSIVDLMGGTLHVESAPGKGTKFEVVLEFRVDGDADRAIDRLNILLLCGERLLATNIRAAVSGKPVVIHHAETAAEAETLLHEHKIDVVLLSGQPYGEELTKLARSLRAASGNPLMIFCLDYARPDESLQAQLDENGVDGLIPRPFFLSNLENEVSRVRSRTDKTEEDGESVLSGMRFLCAEDNELNAEILQALLEMSNAICEICPDGQAITERFQTVQPDEFDVILMDIQMPRMDGYTATRTIRSGDNPLGREIPIVAMTANAFSDDIQHSLEAGMDAHISKPVDMNVLEYTMRGFLSMENGRRVFRRFTEK